MRNIAVLSDIHGNRWALEAVLADIATRAVTNVVNLGDSFYGPLDPRGTADILVKLGFPTVSGNEDRIVVDGSDAAGSATLRFTRSSLRQDHLEWLERLEPTAVAFGCCFLCHGSPENDSEYLLYEVNDTDVRRVPLTALLDRLSGVRQPVILCGHDHVPASLRLPNGQLVANPGSVGLPAYADDSPHPHVMQTGTPHARYCILHFESGDWKVESVSVEYDWERASRVALENGRPDWARWILSGRV